MQTTQLVSNQETNLNNAQLDRDEWKKIISTGTRAKKANKTTVTA